MNRELPEYESKSVEMLAFEIYCRAVHRIPHGEIRAELERKFNIWHDPANGQFTFAQGGSTAPRSADWGSVSQPKLAHQPKSPTSKVPAKAPDLPKDWRKGGVMPFQTTEKRADHAMSQFNENIARGMAFEDAAAWAANSEAESRGDHTLRQESGGPGRGFFQLGSNVAKMDRRIDFQDAMGVSIEKSTKEQQLQFRDWELAHKEWGAKRKIDAAVGAGDKAHAIAMYYLRPAHKQVRAIERANLAEAIIRRVKATVPAKKPGNGLHFLLPDSA